MAERALQGVGDAGLGEWRERGQNGIMHIRRRLTDAERRAAGDLQVRDIRGTPEEYRRLARLQREQPQLREILRSMASTTRPSTTETPGAARRPHHNNTRR